jgi:hypothetical protein
MRTKTYVRGRLSGNDLVRWTPVISETQSLLWACGGNQVSELMRVCYQNNGDVAPKEVKRREALPFNITVL